MWFNHRVSRLVWSIQDVVGYPHHHPGNPLGITGALADIRFVSSILLTWVVAVWIVFGVSGVFSTSFVSFGPSPDLMFFNSPLDTWGKFSAVAAFTAVDQIFQSVSSNIVFPWITNDVQDRKQRNIEYSKVWVYRIRASYSTFVIMSSVIRIAVSLSQISFILIMAAARVFTVVMVTRINLKGKKCNSKCTSVEHLVLPAGVHNLPPPPRAQNAQISSEVLEAARMHEKIAERHLQEARQVTSVATVASRHLESEMHRVVSLAPFMRRGR